VATTGINSSDISMKSGGGRLEDQSKKMSIDIIKASPKRKGLRED